MSSLKTKERVSLLEDEIRELKIELRSARQRIQSLESRPYYYPRPYPTYPPYPRWPTYPPYYWQFGTWCGTSNTTGTTVNAVMPSMTQNDKDKLSTTLTLGNKSVEWTDGEVGKFPEVDEPTTYTVSVRYGDNNTSWSSNSLVDSKANYSVSIYS